MKFVNREGELRALAGLGAGLAVVWGRRRVGKTRLLLEWCRREGGVYTVADQSAPDDQRAYFARSVAAALSGFDDVTYPSWERLFTRLAADAAARRFTGPLVIDELPYLVANAPELPSVLQRWIDHDARRAGLRVAVAGSSQRMMQGLVLAADAPLYGRAAVLLDLAPIAASHLSEVFPAAPVAALIEHWTAWGGVPRYWELATTRRGSVRDRLVELALDPLGPLFSEPERLLLEETPSAIEMRPVLDAIGAGAHRASEIAGRIGMAATSLGKPLDRLMAMGMVRRDTPYGEPARGGKRSLYQIDDPFLRLWYRVVAPNRAALVAGTAVTRRALLDAHWDHLAATAWEELCRRWVAIAGGPVAAAGPWRPAQRYWRGDEPEWDVVADAVDGSQVLLCEVWHSHRALTAGILEREAARVAARPAPSPVAGRPTVRALMVPAVVDAPRRVAGVLVVTAADVLRRGRR